MDINITPVRETNKYIRRVRTFSPFIKYAPPPMIVIDKLVFGSSSFSFVSLKSGGDPDRIGSRVVTKALPGVSSSRELRGDTMVVNQFVGKIHIRGKRSRLAHLTLSSSPQMHWIQFAEMVLHLRIAHPPSRPRLRLRRREAVKRPRTSMGISAFRVSLCTSLCISSKSTPETWPTLITFGRYLLDDKNSNWQTWK